MIRAIFVAIVFLALAFILFLVSGERTQCKARGGVIVQQPWGTACVQELKP